MSPDQAVLGGIPTSRNRVTHVQAPVLEIKEMRWLPCVPLSHPLVERLTGTIRRELPVQARFWNDTDLNRKLADFRHDYNSYRSRSGQDGHTPAEISGNSQSRHADLGRFSLKTHCLGLYPLAA